MLYGEVLSPSRAFRLIWLLTGLMALGCSAEDIPTVAPPRHLVLVVFDTLRADRLSIEGYERETTPFLESQRSKLLRFSRATATAPWTVPSHASIFTGLRPAQHWARWDHSELDDRFVTLAEVLGEEGFATRGVSANNWVGDLANLDQGFDAFTEVGGPWNEKTRRILDLFPDEVEKGLSSRERLFLFANFMHNHIPFQAEQYAEEFGLEGEQPIRSFRDKWDVTGGRRYLSDRDRRRHQAAYDASVRLTDDVARDILRLLEERGILEETLVVFTSDHGEGLGYHQELGHTVSVWEEQLRVPLILRLPQGRRGGEVFDERTSLAALTPTLLDLLGLERPEAFRELPDLFAAARSPITADYRSYFSDSNRGLNRRNRSRYPQLAEDTNHRHVLYCGDFKFVAEAGEADSFFDLEADPRELDDLALDHPEALSRCRERYEELLGQGVFTGFDQEPPAGRQGGELPQTMLEALRNLGYVIDPVPSLEERFDELPPGDPLTDQKILRRYRPHRYFSKVGRALSGGRLSVGHVEYEGGVAAHATCWLLYDVEGSGARRLTGRVGRDDNSAGGSVRAYVFVDGQLAFASGSLERHAAARGFELDVDGASTVALATWTDSDGDRGDHVDWIEPRLVSDAEAIYEPGETLSVADLLPAGGSSEGLEAQSLADIPEGDLEVDEGAAREGLALTKAATLTYDLGVLGATRLVGRVSQRRYQGEPPEWVDLSVDDGRVLRGLPDRGDTPDVIDIALPPRARSLTIRTAKTGGEGRLVLEGLRLETSREVWQEARRGAAAVEPGRRWRLAELPPAPPIPSRLVADWTPTRSPTPRAATPRLWLVNGGELHYALTGLGAIELTGSVELVGGEGCAAQLRVESGEERRLARVFLDGERPTAELEVDLRQARALVLRVDGGERCFVVLDEVFLDTGGEGGEGGK